MGRTGAITPVARLNLFRLAGLLCQMLLYITLMKSSLGIRIGDDVVVARAGDVIPKIVRQAKAREIILWNFVPIAMPSM